MAAFVIFNSILIYFGITLLCIKFCCCNFENINEDSIPTNEFYVKPGGTTYSLEKTLDDVTCQFTYACQGGTSEQWLFSMTKSKDGSGISCSVERPDGKSYLFFQLFGMHITGGYIKEAQVFGENKRPLPSSEYIITEGNSLVKEVDGEFQSHLDKVEVYVTPGRQEL